MAEHPLWAKCRSRGRLSNDLIEFMFAISILNNTSIFRYKNFLDSNKELSEKIKILYILLCYNYLYQVY